MRNFYHDLLFFCRFARYVIPRFAKRLDIETKLEYNENSKLCARVRGKEMP